MSSNNISRRQFFKNTAAWTSVALLSPYATGLFAEKQKYTAADLVPLGKTGLQLSRLGLGTGSNDGNIQRALGHEGFDRLIRYAYDRGITYIDTAENYRTHTWIRQAIKGLPREKLYIQTKMFDVPEKPLEVIDRYRQELGIDYIDCLLLHCKVQNDWDKSHKRLMDAFEEAKARKIIRAHGVSCHSLPALKTAARLDWVDVNLVRINPQGAYLDTNGGGGGGRRNPARLQPVMEQLKIMREKGHGIIGMKIIGNGDFTNIEDRKRSIQFAMQPGLVDAIVIGFKSTAEMDEAIAHIERSLTGNSEELLPSRKL
jgi:predicted aldo/keto reductase-like oxidoreductase